ncbi:ParB N-terminal domain-containing protein [Burkholderia cenocepacia]|uniref:hypothetical protein n=1 Tax=Burkholderia cenocepacia TaxID=95486 RepID=UPI0022323F62|nr:hypothetical protein [Burkholderia cenocepacia]MCW3610738.1 hypothetical protein [Burkholderia cenocepacia]MCW5189291.1 hypothetical protein [Burkholderia cenocepacia]
MNINRPTAKRQFTFGKWGVFGTFETKNSLPIEYLQTSLSIEELEQLTLARDINPENRDFELMMQRDIDEGRVKSEIMKYLSPDSANSTNGEQLARPTFFPPLLVAVIPTRGEKILKYLPNATVAFGTIEGEQQNYLQRSWGRSLRVSYFESDVGELYKTDDGKDVVADIISPVKVDIRQSPELGDSEGVRLVVFDGQHRLSALLLLAEYKRAVTSKIRVPVCIVWSPNSTLEVEQSSPENFRPAHEVFRQLFVDVNKNAVAVGGHFSTLLADSDIGKISARIFCEQVLEHYGEVGLAAVEWNIRNPKDATQIRRPYSLTSIGVIEVALKKALSGKSNSGLLRYALDLVSVEADLYPKDVEYDYPNPIHYERFSPNQRMILEQQIRSLVVQKGILRLFFETEEYALARKLFDEVVGRHQKIVENQEPGFESSAAVLKHILDYKPFEEGSVEFEAKEKQFFREVAQKYDSGINPIIRYGVFQGAFINRWLYFIETLRSNDEFDLGTITTAFIGLANFALQRKRGLFDMDRPYMSYSVFKARNIRPTEGTRKALGYLITACLGDETVTDKFLIDLGVDDGELKAQLISIGLDAATHFAGHLRKERMLDFTANYAQDFSISQAEREDLAKSEKRKNDLKIAVRAGAATKSELEQATREFERQVETYVQTELNNALIDLKGYLNYKTEIIALSSLEEDESEEIPNGV